MNYDVYLDLIEKEEYHKAIAYKMSCIPDTLYKYWWLDDETNHVAKERNDLRLSTLANGQVYLSATGQFNDPFEGKAFVFDDGDASNGGFTAKEYQVFVDHINSHSRICCLSNADEKHQNMPMWAYYANNHRGFCVEYRLSPEHKRYIFPVSYDKSRVKGNVFMRNLILGISKMVKEGKDSSQMSGTLSVYNHLAYLSLTCKHASWKHEKEYRALVPAERGIYWDIEPHKIYVGMNCSAEHERRLTEIAKQFEGCKIFKMQEPNTGTDFDVIEVEIK